MYKFLVIIRSGVLVYLTHKMALPILKIFRNEPSFPYSSEELKSFPEKTLGYQLIMMLEEKKLDLLPYYARHDIKHILLEYDTTGEGEVCLQCFMLGNRHISFPVISTVLYGISTMPEHWGSFKKAFQRGRVCENISAWRWFELMHEPIHNLRQKVLTRFSQ